MTSKRTKVAMIVVGVLLLVSALAMAVVGTNGEPEKAVTVIQYKVVPVSSPMTQQQLQAVLTAQGNAGWHFLGPFAVGTGPIPNDEVLLFSKP